MGDIKYNQYNFQASGSRLEYCGKKKLIPDNQSSNNDAAGLLMKSFSAYLSSENLSSVSQKNYLADLRHFLGWFIFTLSRNRKTEAGKFNPSLLRLINEALISDYKKFLVVNKVATKTVNRRLSTLRKFGEFCLKQGLISENPAKKVNNQPLEVSYEDKGQEILREFKKALEEEKVAESTVKNYLADVRQFINWVETLLLI